MTINNKTNRKINNSKLSSNKNELIQEENKNELVEEEKKNNEHIIPRKKIKVELNNHINSIISPTPSQILGNNYYHSNNSSVISNNKSFIKATKFPIIKPNPTKQSYPSNQIFTSSKATQHPKLKSIKHNTQLPTHNLFSSIEFGKITHQLRKASLISSLKIPTLQEQQNNQSQLHRVNSTSSFPLMNNSSINNNHNLSIKKYTNNNHKNSISISHSCNDISHGISNNGSLILSTSQTKINLNKKQVKYTFYANGKKIEATEQQQQQPQPTIEPTLKPLPKQQQPLSNHDEPIYTLFHPGNKLKPQEQQFSVKDYLEKQIELLKLNNY